MRTQHCTLVFIVDNNRVLLAMKKRGFGAGRWNGPGGKVEKGENEITATVRECEEEIAVTPRLPKKVANMKFLYKGEDKPMQVVVHVYKASEWAGEPAESEEMAPRWFSFDKVPYDDMWEDDRYWLPQVLDGKNVIGEFEFDKNDKVIAQNVKVVNEKELNNVKI